MSLGGPYKIGYLNDEQICRAAVLDTAIETAIKESKDRDGIHGAGRMILVTDLDAVPHAVRGYAVGGRWTWSKPCKPCRGTGRNASAAHSGQAPQCRTCGGSGWVT